MTDSNNSSESSSVTTLLLVDVQKDFHPGGSLAIPTANDDAARITELIRNHPHKIDRVVATMDSHVKLHIAHPGFWVPTPDPFTIITSHEIVDGKWTPRQDLKIPDGTLDESVFGSLAAFTKADGSLDITKYAIEYTKRLEERGKFKLCIWPEHCLIGSAGIGMVDQVQEALYEWSAKTGGTVEWVLKGQNLLTESYSAMEAEVPNCKATSFNEALQKSLQKSDRLLVCGQAMSHCVNYTLSSIVERWDKDKLHQITLITDAASFVPGFAEAGKAFQEDMAKAGVLLKKSSELF